MIILLLVMMLAVSLCVCATLALWFFGVRPYIHRKGRVCITAANWGFSIWADMSTVWEIGKEEGRIPASLKWLLALQVMEILIRAAVFSD